MDALPGTDHPPLRKEEIRLQTQQVQTKSKSILHHEAGDGAGDGAILCETKIQCDSGPLDGKTRRRFGLFTPPSSTRRQTKASSMLEPRVKKTPKLPPEPEPTTNYSTTREAQPYSSNFYQTWPPNQPSSKDIREPRRILHRQYDPNAPVHPLVLDDDSSTVYNDFSLESHVVYFTDFSTPTPQLFPTGVSGEVSEMSDYTPNDTPESDRSGVSEPVSEISEIGTIDDSTDLFTNNWQPCIADQFEFLFDPKDDDDLFSFPESTTLMSSAIVNQSISEMPFVPRSEDTAGSFNFNKFVPSNLTISSVVPGVHGHSGGYCIPSQSKNTESTSTESLIPKFSIETPPGEFPLVLDCINYEIGEDEKADPLSVGTYKADSLGVTPHPDTAKVVMDPIITTDEILLPSSLGLLDESVHEQETALYGQQRNMVTSKSADMSETCSWSSDNDTDWGEDESEEADSFNSSNSKEFAGLITKPVLSRAKLELVDRLMEEFWDLFNQGKECKIYEDTLSRRSGTDVGSPCENDASSSDGSNNLRQNSDDLVSGSAGNNSQHGKRKRESQDGDDDGNGENDNRGPKKPRTFLSPPQSQDDAKKFACPYRKNDPTKYCVRHWRSCALTPLETVARVKGHLYRHHRIFPCQRCKTLFRDQQEVDNHLKEPEGCRLVEGVKMDGITNEIVEKLRSKKKTTRDQSEEDRWTEIYRIIFPGEAVPLPFYEEIQEDFILSPDSRDLAEYEDYCRRELPRVFRASLEQIVNNSTQPLEEQLRVQLMDLIRDAQDRVFSSYRSSSPRSLGTPSRSFPNTTPLATPSSSSSQRPLMTPPRSQPPERGLENASRAQLAAFYLPPTPQNGLESSLDIFDPTATPSKPDRNNRSDSGYRSEPSSLPSTLPLTPSTSSNNPPAFDLQALLDPEKSQGSLGDAGDAVILAQTHYNVDAVAKSGENSILDSDFYLSNPFDFDSKNVDLSEIDFEGVWQV